LQLSELTKKLSRLANTVNYNQATATLSIDGYGNGQRAIEDLVYPHLLVNDEPIDWTKLTALSAKRKLQERAR
jgi:hypothetical protein